MAHEYQNIRYYAKAGAFEVYGISDEGEKKLDLPCYTDDPYLNRMLDGLAAQHPSGFVVRGQGIEDYLSKQENIAEYTELLMSAMAKHMTPVRTEVDLERMRELPMGYGNNSLSWSFPDMSGFENIWYRSLEFALAGLMGTGYEAPASRETWEDRIRTHDELFPLGKR